MIMNLKTISNINLGVTVIMIIVNCLFTTNSLGFLSPLSRQDLAFYNSVVTPLFALVLISSLFLVYSYFRRHGINQLRLAMALLPIAIFVLINILIIF